MAKYLLGCLGLAVLGFIVLFMMLAGGYNGLVGQKQSVDAAWAEVENQYQRRADLIPNLVGTVAGAANFEKSTLEDVVKARASVGQVKLDPNQAPTDPAQLKQFQAAQDSLGGALSRLLVVSENYPNLKSNENFLNLQAQLEGTENRITTARERFNTAAQSYNTAVQTFPTVLYAGLFGFSQRPYFTAKEGSDTPPPVNFNFNTNGT